MDLQQRGRRHFLGGQRPAQGGGRGLQDLAGIHPGRRYSAADGHPDADRGELESVPHQRPVPSAFHGRRPDHAVGRILYGRRRPGPAGEGSPGGFLRELKPGNLPGQGPHGPRGLRKAGPEERLSIAGFRSNQLDERASPCACELQARLSSLITWSIPHATVFLAFIPCKFPDICLYCNWTCR